MNCMAVSDLRRVLRHDPHLVVDDLKETALDLKPWTGARRAEPELALTEKRHHRRMAGEDPYNSIERRCDDGFRRPLEQHGFRRDDRDV